MEAMMSKCPTLIMHHLIVDAEQSVIDWLMLMKHFPGEASTVGCLYEREKTT